MPYLPSPIARRGGRVWPTLHYYRLPPQPALPLPLGRPPEGRADSPLPHHLAGAVELEQPLAVADDQGVPVGQARGVAGARAGVLPDDLAGGAHLHDLARAVADRQVAIAGRPLDPAPAAQ